MKKGKPSHRCFLPTWSYWLHFLHVLQTYSVTHLVSLQQASAPKRRKEAGEDGMGK